MILAKAGPWVDYSFFDVVMALTMTLTKAMSMLRL